MSFSEVLSDGSVACCAMRAAESEAGCPRGVPGTAPLTVAARAWLELSAPSGGRARPTTPPRFAMALSGGGPREPLPFAAALICLSRRGSAQRDGSDTAAQCFREQDVLAVVVVAYFFGCHCECNNPHIWSSLEPPRQWSVFSAPWHLTFPLGASLAKTSCPAYLHTPMGVGGTGRGGAEVGKREGAHIGPTPTRHSLREIA